MTELSPTGQAVKTAAVDAYWLFHPGQAAAIIRAAASLAQDNPWPGRIESVGVMWMHDELLAIAAELDPSP